MIITAEQLSRIAASGGGLVLDASAWTFPQLKEIVTAANGGKARITLKTFANMTATQLDELAVLAPGLIVFDLTS
ncbi:MAG TPA: hypothetical protein VKU39_18330 [Streptosporangiaceae bacterium]|nr:hypothetical protein [Streptosporangiaceae bacterium]